jgi:hypothetical protein
MEPKWPITFLISMRTCETGLLEPEKCSRNFIFAIFTFWFRLKSVENKIHSVRRHAQVYNVSPLLLIIFETGCSFCDVQDEAEETADDVNITLEFDRLQILRNLEVCELSIIIGLCNLLVRQFKYLSYNVCTEIFTSVTAKAHQVSCTADVS